MNKKKCCPALGQSKEYMTAKMQSAQSDIKHIRDPFCAIYK